jgi:hypothetical protein
MPRRRRASDAIADDGKVERRSGVGVHPFYAVIMVGGRWQLV